MNSLLVRKCICHNIDFVDIRKRVIENSIENASELQAGNICGTKCQMCIPYIEILLKTGKVEFKPRTFISRNKAL